jgi:hypothetical protein
MAIWKTVLETLFKSVASAIIDWWKNEKAEAAAWEAKARKVQMESMKEGKRIELEAYRKAKKIKASKSPAEWNKKHAASAIVLLFCFLTSGCFRFYVAAREYKPVLEKPEAPTMEDITTPWSKREQKLVKWSEQLEMMIDEYNEWAKANNRKNGYSD